MRNLRTIAFILMIMLSFTSCKKEYATLSDETEFLLGTWMNTTPNQPISKIIFEHKGCYVKYRDVRSDYIRYEKILISEKSAYYGSIMEKTIKIFNTNKKNKSLKTFEIILYKNDNDSIYDLSKITIFPNPPLFNSDSDMLFSYFKKI